MQTFLVYWTYLANYGKVPLKTRASSWEKACQNVYTRAFAGEEFKTLATLHLVCIEGPDAGMNRIYSNGKQLEMVTEMCID